ncbi:hypothetical protein IR012_03550 [Pseudomonas putida]|uniref:hypothetical protein n=1 Tax=Pseudomonas putida TaxID=303 RepID=UPI0018A99C03|nr:hypothetical protein [Pseudomonas putida]MBF8667978.1 hypothetical protein [Pseudomonas putida]MBF8711389.1 hypothetical protein [Pseudomonas putida]
MQVLFVGEAFFDKELKMHPTKAALTAELDAVEAALKANVPAEQIFSVAHGNWSFPSVALSDLVAPLTLLRSTLGQVMDDEIDAHDSVLQGFLPRFAYLRSNTVPQIWGSPQIAVSAYFITIDAFQRLLRALVKVDDGGGLLGSVRINARQLRAVEVRVKDLTARSEDLTTIIERIEAANDAALQLPEDLETLREGRDRVRDLVADAEKDRLHVFSAKEIVEGVQKDLSQVAIDTAEVVKKADQAYSAATSQGLAAAFADRSAKLGQSMIVWVVALVLSLGLGSWFGKGQLERLAELIKSQGASDTAIVINLVLSIFSVGAPIWFAWLSTKQIGQRFRLSEDYAFKATVSKAYEGYRREANRIDPVLESQLLRSALSRLDEQPLRFVEPASYGSPWHELISSDAIKDAVKTVPGFAEQMAQLAKNALARTTSGKQSAEVVDIASTSTSTSDRTVG